MGYRRKRLPRIVTLDWIEQSWEAKTLLDEEREIKEINRRMRTSADLLDPGFAPY